MADAFAVKMRVPLSSVRGRRLPSRWTARNHADSRITPKKYGDSYKMQRKRGHWATMMPQVPERIHQKTATTLWTVRTAHNQFAKGIVPVQRPSSMRSESGYCRAPVLSRSRLLGQDARCWISCDKGRYHALDLTVVKSTPLAAHNRGSVSEWSAIRTLVRNRLAEDYSR